MELKCWIKPSLKTGKAILIKALFALRHHRHGGFLLIGFHDKTLEPIPFNGNTSKIRSIYHPENIQKLIFDYSYDPFEIHVQYEEREGQIHPIICVDEGVDRPVFTKKNIIGDDRKCLLKKDSIYVRTLRSNGTVSSALVKHADWPDLIDTFVRNRSRLANADPEMTPQIESESLIVQVWMEFERTAQKFLVSRGYGLKKTFRGLGMTLKSSGILDSRHLIMLDSLRNLRNLAVHSEAGATNSDDVDEARRLSSELCKYLNSKDKS